MPTDVLILVATAVLALVAVVAAAVAVRAVRRLERTSRHSPETGPTNADSFVPAGGLVPVIVEPDVDVEPVRPVELQPRLVQGRVVVPPTQEQVLATVLGRPGVRLNVVLFGLAHALRAENRDRIGALMRREYRQRRRERLRAGRAAARVTPIRKVS